MPCEIEFWQHAKNATTMCPHPAIVHCSDCRVGLCSAHILECEVCEHFICSDCQPEHERQHKLAERQLGKGRVH
jgi:predicted sulfurtransferase